MYFCTSIYFLILINIPRTKKQSAGEASSEAYATEQIERTMLSDNRTLTLTYSLSVWNSSYSVICFRVLKKKVSSFIESSLFPEGKGCRIFEGLVFDLRTKSNKKSKQNTQSYIFVTKLFARNIKVNELWESVLQHHFCLRPPVCNVVWSYFIIRRARKDCPFGAQGRALAVSHHILSFLCLFDFNSCNSVLLF